MSIRTLPRPLAAGLCTVLTIAALAGCKGSDKETSAASQPSADSQAGADSVGAGASAGAKVVAESTPVGKFELTVPAGFKQGVFKAEHPAVRLITANSKDGANDNDDIIVESLKGTGATPESRFSYFLDYLKTAQPGCKFPTGADHKAEAIAPGFTSDYIVYKCDQMPFTVVNFTSRGPAGLLVAGYQQSTTKDTESWKAAVGSIVTS